MERDIQEKKQLMAKRYRQSPRHTIQVDYATYIEELGKKIGVVPSFFSLLFKDPDLAIRVMFGPAIPAIYRITGPGAWKGAPQAIKNTFKNSYAGLGVKSLQQR